MLRGRQDERLLRAAVDHLLVAGGVQAVDVGEGEPRVAHHHLDPHPVLEVLARAAVARVAASAGAPFGTASPIAPRSSWFGLPSSLSSYSTLSAVTTR